MRTIKFRGKDFAGKWVYGFPAIGNESAIINPILKDGSVQMGMSFFVDKETIGQFVYKTHVKAKRKVCEIYEGDILRGYQPYHEDTPITGVVKWDEDTQRFNLLSTENYINQLVVFSVIEILGNIHDNPELMKEEGKWRTMA